MRALSLALVVVFAGACGQEERRSGPSPVTRSADQPLNPSPTLGDFVIEAQNSVRLRSDAVVAGGDVGARGTGQGPFLADAAALSVGSGARVDVARNVIADSVRLAQGATVGDVQTNRLVGNGAHGVVSGLVALPALPPLSPVVPGTTNVTVRSGVTQTSSPGRFARIRLNQTSVLQLSPGVYEMSELSLGSGARLEVSGAVELRIGGRLDTAGDAFIGAASGVTLAARDIRIEVSGQNGTTGTLDATPRAVTLGARNRLSVLMLAPNGTLVIGADSVVSGAFMARDVDVHANARVNFADGLTGPACTASSCDDGNPCTSDSCSGSGCVHASVPVGSSCSDGDACNGAETCDAAGQCAPGTAVVCAALDACHVAGSCDPATGVCSNPEKPNGASCDDGDACTRADACQAGSCVGADPVVCAASGPCRAAGSCDSSTGVCSNPELPDGTGCDDGDACTITDACQAGSCVSGEPVVCEPADGCHAAGVCDSLTGSCVRMPLADGTTCDDGNACTASDACSAGACAGVASVTCTTPPGCEGPSVCVPASGECSPPTDCVANLPPETSIVAGPADRAVLPSNQTVAYSIAAEDDFTPRSELSFQWRVDEGQWQGPVPAGDISLEGLAEGEHRFEVAALDGQGNVDATPAARSFSLVSYGARLLTASRVAPAGTPLALSGVAERLDSFEPAPFVAVTVVVSTQGIKRTLPATSDESGEFEVTFEPLATEAGQYDAWARHPAASDPPPQTEFTLVGMHLSPGTVTSSTAVGMPLSGVVTLENLGDTPLTGITSSVSGAPAGSLFNADVPATLAPRARVPLAYEFTSSDAGAGTTATVTLTLQSQEGAVVALPFVLTIEPQVPRLTFSPEELDASMVVGTQRVVTLTVKNSGGAASEPVPVNVPFATWLSLSSSPTVPALAPGESADVVLLLNPPADLDLGVYSGELGIGSHTIPFQFNATSDQTGGLRIVVSDEFSFYDEANGFPKVAGATVTVTDPFTRSVVASGLTNGAGIFDASALPAGSYDVAVREPEHSTYQAQLEIQPNEPTRVDVFLHRNLVTYEWMVVPTPVPDVYDITVQALFQTNVPAPVVTVDPAYVDPRSLYCRRSQRAFTLTNHGLVRADDLSVGVGGGDACMTWRFSEEEGREVCVEWARCTVTPLVTAIGDLTPGESTTVPILFDCPCYRNSDFDEPPGGGTGGSSGDGGSGGGDSGAGGSAGSSGGGNGGSSGSGGSPPGYGPDRIPSNSVVAGCSENVSVVFEYNQSCSGKSQLEPVSLHDSHRCWGIGDGQGVPSGWPGGGGIARGGPNLNVPITCVPCQGRLMFWAIRSAIRFTPMEYGIKEVKLVVGAIHNPPTETKEQIKLGKEIVETGAKILKFSAPDKINAAIKSAQDLLDTLESEECKEFFDLGPGAIGNIAELRKDLKYLQLYKKLYDTLFTGLKAADAGNTKKFLEWAAEAREAVTEDSPGSFKYILDEIDQLVARAEEIRTRNADDTTQIQSQLMSSAADTVALEAESEEFEFGGEFALAFMERWNRFVDATEAGILDKADLPPGANPDFFSFNELVALFSEFGVAEDEAAARGFESTAHKIQSDFDGIVEMASIHHTGVCATVRVELDQTAVLTRQGFKATLQVNDTDASDITNIRVDLEIQDPSGTPRNERFFVPAPELSNLSDVNGGGTVSGGSSGSATWTIVPADDAAPDGTVRYRVGGTLSYTFKGVSVTTPLFPTPIDVMPNPSLVAHYFWPKDVIADNPFTFTKEPPQPFPIGLLMTNQGAGLARDVRITSYQPQIFDNEKDLLINFKLIGTQVNGQAATPSLTAALGDIPPGATRQANWLMTSSLTGRFVSYAASYEHVSGPSDLRHTILDQVEVHRLIHPVRVEENDDGLHDFLANDNIDLVSAPETLYLSDGSTRTVLQFAVPAPHPSFELRVPDLPSGYVHIHFPSRFKPIRVVRSDGKEIMAGDNLWWTEDLLPREVTGGQFISDTGGEIHIFDKDSTGSYEIHDGDIGGFPLSIQASPTSFVLAQGSSADFPIQVAPSPDDVHMLGIVNTLDGAFGAMGWQEAPPGLNLGCLLAPTPKGVEDCYKQYGANGLTRCFEFEGPEVRPGFCAITVSPEVPPGTYGLTLHVTSLTRAEQRFDVTVVDDGSGGSGGSGGTGGTGGGGAGGTGGASGGTSGSGGTAGTAGSSGSPGTGHSCADGTTSGRTANLVYNGNAEVGPGINGPNDDDIAPPGWFRPYGGITVLRYGAQGGPRASDPGSPTRGSNLFAGGFSTLLASLEQRIDVSDHAQVIDEGGVTYDLSAWLGAFEDQEDYVSVGVGFTDAVGKGSGWGAEVRVKPTDSHPTEMVRRETSGTVPPGTRSISITMFFVRWPPLGAWALDAYVDDIELTLTWPCTSSCSSPPECQLPGTYDAVTGFCDNIHQPDGTACSDDDPCTLETACVAGQCTGTPIVCAAADQCHLEGVCVSSQGGCVYVKKTDGTICDDGDECSQGDQCLDGTCTGIAPVANGTACDDENACTSGEACQAGECTGTTAVTCAPPGACQEPGTCNPQTGLCSYPARADGSSCDDSNACTRSDSCQAGVCSGGNPVVCEGGDACRTTACNPGTGACGFVNRPDGTSCANDLTCDGVESCQAGACVASNAVSCDDGNPCTSEVCVEPGSCESTPLADGSSCTLGGISGSCTASTCVLNAPDFTVALEPNRVTIPRGGHANLAVSVEGRNAFSGSVALAVAPEPGVVTNLPPSLGPGERGTLALDVAADAELGTRSLALTATSGALVHTVELELSIVETGTPVHRIDSAGTASVAPFEADAFFEGGGVAETGVTIDTSGLVNPAPEAVYRSVRYAHFRYRLPNLAPGADYTVRLHFAEAFVLFPGQRVFNVLVNGVPVLVDFDVIVAAGAPFRGVIEEINAVADVDGRIEIEFVSVVEAPIVSGIEVLTGEGVPSAPYDLRAMPGDGEVLLLWDSAAGAESYSVYRRTGPGIEVLVASGVTDREFLDTDVTNGTTYYYRVTAENAVGESTASNEASATPDAGSVPAYRIRMGSFTGSDPFMADRYFAGGGHAQTGASLDLASVEDPAPLDVYQSLRYGTFTYTLPDLEPGAGYRVRLHFAEWVVAFPGQRVFDVRVNGVTVLDDFDVVVAAGGAFRAVVKELNAVADAQGRIVIEFVGGNEASIVNGIEVLTGVDVPDAPFDLRALPGDGRVRLVWKSPGADGYSVYRGTSPGAETLLASGVTETTFVDQSVTNGTTYYYRVTAENDVGESAPSNQASATPGADTAVYLIRSGGLVPAGPFAADRYFTGGGIAQTGTGIDLSGVEDPAPAELYRDLRYGTFTYTLPDLEPGAEYTVRLHFAEWMVTFAGQRTFDVRANGVTMLDDFDVIVAADGPFRGVVESFAVVADENGRIVLEFVSVAEASVLSGIEVLNGTHTPSAPFDLRALPGNGEVRLLWKGAGAPSYHVYRGTTPDELSLIAPDIMETEFFDDGVVNGTTYYYRVTAENDVGESAESNEGIATPDTGSLPLYRIRSGGFLPAAPFAVDRYFFGGGALQLGNAIDVGGVEDPAPQAVYQTLRYGNFTYVFPDLEPGAEHLLRLHFSDTYATSPGQRAFDVRLNGVPVLVNYDIFVSAGGAFRAVVEEFPAIADDQGEISLEFVSLTNPALVNAVEVFGVEAP